MNKIENYIKRNDQDMAQIYEYGDVHVMQDLHDFSYLLEYLVFLNCSISNSCIHGGKFRYYELYMFIAKVCYRDWSVSFFYSFGR